MLNRLKNNVIINVILGVIASLFHFLRLVLQRSKNENNDRAFRYVFLSSLQNNKTERNFSQVYY